MPRRIKKYMAPDSIHTIHFRCLIFPWATAAPRKAAASSWIIMPYPILSGSIPPLCTSFASSRHPASVVPILTAAPRASPPGMLMALPVGFAVFIMLPSPFTTAYSCPGIKRTGTGNACSGVLSLLTFPHPHWQASWAVPGLRSGCGTSSGYPEPRRGPWR